MNKAKKALKMVEGERLDLEYFTLIPGEHELGRVMDELDRLTDAFLNWREGNWKMVSAQDSKHQEIIPLMGPSGKSQADKPKGPQHSAGLNPTRYIPNR